MKELISIKSGQLLSSGIWPSVDPTAVPAWHDGTNVVFRKGGVQSSPGWLQAISQANASRALAQAYVNGLQRFYFNIGTALHWYENGVDNLMASGLAVEGDPYLEPYGTWLLVANKQDNLKLWKNGGALISIGADQFTRPKIIKKLGPFTLAYNTSAGPTHVHWHADDNVETWTPAANNTARNYVIRDLDGEIMAVAELGDRHAVYSRDTLVLGSFIGYPSWFGFKRQLNGIGAVGRNAIVPFGPYNFGLSKTGIFKTDGVSFQYVDDPAFKDWLQANVDWTDGENVVGYHDELKKQIIWYFKSKAGDRKGAAIDPETMAFSPASGGFTAAIERQVWDYPIGANSTGIHWLARGLNANNVALSSFVMSRPLAGQSKEQTLVDFYKAWQYVRLDGSASSSVQVRFGLSNVPEVPAIEWLPYKPWGREFWFNRESVYLWIEIRSSQFGASWNLAGISVFGEVAGRVS